MADSTSVCVCVCRGVISAQVPSFWREMLSVQKRSGGCEGSSMRCEDGRPAASSRTRQQISHHRPAGFQRLRVFTGSRAHAFSQPPTLKASDGFARPEVVGSAGTAGNLAVAEALASPSGLKVKLGEESRLSKSPFHLLV